MSTVTKETREGPLKEVAASSSAPTVRQQSQGKKRAEGLLRAAIKDAVKLNHVEVASERPEEARPVLILHGLLGSSRNFASFTSELSGKLEKPRRFIIPDLRNHGDSIHARSMGCAHHPLSFYPSFVSLSFSLSPSLSSLFSLSQSFPPCLVIFVCRCPLLCPSLSPPPFSLSSMHPLTFSSIPARH
jgi:hypothetical protein